MKIRYLSDLHLEFTGYLPNTLPSIGEDVVVLAGDIGLGVQGITWAKMAIPDRPVIYALGNHEYYRHHWATLIDQCHAEAAGSHVHFLENDAVVLNGIRFLGCTYWTDFRGRGVGTQDIAMQASLDGLNDYRLIRFGTQGTWPQLTPADVLARHLESRAWLDHEITASAEPCVVITHHGPSMIACAPQYQGDWLTASFLNDHDAMLRAPVRAWIFGHTHNSGRWEINGIPLLSNQRGYPRESHPGFSWEALIEIGGSHA